MSAGDPSVPFLRAWLLAPEPRELSPGEVMTWKRSQGLLFAHFDLSISGAGEWLAERLTLPDAAREALEAEETRPRLAVDAVGLLLNLRGVNTNPGADPEDMVALRIWCTPDAVLSSQRRGVRAVQDVFELLEEGVGPRTTAALVALLGSRLVDRMAPVLEPLHDAIDDLEEIELVRESADLESRLVDVRRQLIAYRRHLAPQREVMQRLAGLDLPWIGPADRLDFTQDADEITRHVEDLEQLAERARVLQDQLTNHLAMQMNKRMFLFSMIAAIFLPLSLLTGLLGVNVAGIPLAEHPYAFLIVCAALLLVGAAQVLILRRIKWL